MVIIEQRGMDQAILHINRFSQVDRFGLLAALAETVRRQTLIRFTTTKTAPDGKRWAPLKASTIARNRKRTARDILVDTGRLRNSISAKVYGSTASIGTNVFYAKFHQGGTRRMVARPFMGLSRQDLGELERLATAFIAAGLAR